MTIFQLAITFFIIANPLGNCPTIIALIKNHPLKKQQQILLRESLIALALAVFFLFFGEVFLGYLKIDDYALKISGGVLLFVVALNMIFSDHSESPTSQETLEDPFVVPIATPLLAGGGLFATIMTFGAQENNHMKLLLSLSIAWIAVTAVLVAAPYLQVIIGKRGLLALEQLMGMLLAMIAVELLVSGFTLFLQVLTGI